MGKLHLPLLLLQFLAYVCDFIGLLIGKKMKLNPFTVRMLTMNRWFRFDRPEKDLNYKPIIGFKEGWEDTIEWFRVKWLPDFYNSSRASGYGHIHDRSQMKIDMQNKSK